MKNELENGGADTGEEFGEVFNEVEGWERTSSKGGMTYRGHEHAE
jgi:hypothetical protein